MSDPLSRPKSRGVFGSVARLVVFLGMIASIGWGSVWTWNQSGDWFASGPDYQTLNVVEARRVDLTPQVTASGLSNSAQNTLIECQLEEVEAEISGYRDDPESSGSSTILYVVDEGAEVNEGDLLARLDSSEYDDLLLIQEISVDRAAADLETAKLDLEIAKEALREYQGTMVQRNTQIQDQMKVNETLFGQQRDLYDWSKGAFQKGILTDGQLEAARLAFEEIEINTNLTELSYRVFNEFTAYKQQILLRNNVSKAEVNVRSRQRRYDWYYERLEKLREQVEFCTILAPHDGVVIYADDDDDDERIGEGSRVYRRMDMFLLPDLDQMVLELKIHESSIEDVYVGMRGTARFQALGSEAEMAGEITSINTLPMELGSKVDDMVRYYQAAFTLDARLPGLLPKMTGQATLWVEVDRSNSLVVPPDAVYYDDRQPYCLTFDEDGLQRHSLTLGRATTQWLEVLGGLADGDQVVLDPREALAAEFPILDFNAGSSLAQNEVTQEGSSNKSTSF